MASWICFQICGPFMILSKGFLWAGVTSKVMLKVFNFNEQSSHWLESDVKIFQL